VTKKKTHATPPGAVVAVIEQARNAGKPAMALYVWLAAITTVRRGELCGVQIRDIDLDNGWLHVAFNYVVKGSKKVRKDTKTHQDRYPAIDPVTCALIREHLAAVAAALADTGVKLAPSAYLFSNHPANTQPWNPDWASHRVAALAAAAGVELNIKALRHYTASQLLAAGFDLGNTAARLGHSGGGATTLRHYADPVPEADRRAATYLSRLTSNAAAAAKTRRQQQLGRRYAAPLARRAGLCVETPARHGRAAPDSLPQISRAHPESNQPGWPTHRGLGQRSEPQRHLRPR
jgi:integrase